MKTAYELIMERLNKESPLPKLTDEQKKKLAEIDSIYKAKIAELEVVMKEQIDRAYSEGEVEKAEELKRRLIEGKKKLEAEMEEKKEAVRQGKA